MLIEDSKHAYIVGEQIFLDWKFFHHGLLKQFLLRIPNMLLLAMGYFAMDYYIYCVFY